MTGSPQQASPNLIALTQAATAWLRANVDAVNALNVFPVPDGDTGTNMLLTLEAALSAVPASPASPAATREALSQGALLGARGNSGVILSQFVAGLAEALPLAEPCDGRAVAAALAAAAHRAYASVPEPAEGTMLTVARAAAGGAETAARQTADIAQVLAGALGAARTALERTPDLLPVLREAGVVDAGGQGLVLLLEGALAALEGAHLGPGYESLGRVDAGWLKTAHAERLHRAGSAWGYCTEFVIRGDGLSVEKLREDFARYGESLLVVGDAAAVRVHVHAQDPGAPISHAAALGSLHSIKVDNLQEQHGGLLTADARGPAPAANHPAGSRTSPVIAVVPGDGIAQVFLSLGAAAVIAGGDTMNPSVGEIAASAAALGEPFAVVLPNNPNVAAACVQARSLTTTVDLHVVPSHTIPQGIAALLAWKPEADLARNLEAMQQALACVTTLEVTAATREAAVAELAVKPGQYLGLIDRAIRTAARTPGEALDGCLNELDLSPGYLVTLYYGADITEEEAQVLARALRERPDQPEVEVHRGGQPHYHYIASVEA